MQDWTGRIALETGGNFVAIKRFTVNAASVLTALRSVAADKNASSFEVKVDTIVVSLTQVASRTYVQGIVVIRHSGGAREKLTVDLAARTESGASVLLVTIRVAAVVLSLHSVLMVIIMEQELARVVAGAAARAAQILLGLVIN